VGAFTVEAPAPQVLFDPHGLRAVVSANGTTTVYDIQDMADPRVSMFDANYVYVAEAALAFPGADPPRLKTPDGFELVGVWWLASEVLTLVASELRNPVRRKEENSASLNDAAATSAHNHLLHLAMRNRDIQVITPTPLENHPYYRGEAVSLHGTEGLRRAWKNSSEMQRNLLPDMHAARVAMPCYGESRLTYFREVLWLSEQLRNNTAFNAAFTAVMLCASALAFINSYWIPAPLLLG